MPARSRQPSDRFAFHQETTPPAPPEPRADVLLLVGAAGAPEFAPLFAEWAQRWERAAQQGHARVTVIGRDEAATPTDRERVQTALKEAAQIAERPLWVVLIGHGTFDRRTARFNLRGPDVAANELADWLKPLDRPLALIDTSASSEPFLKLGQPRRVVISATKSGGEQNFARFGEYLSQAIADPAADLDKDDQTSLWEAFLAASRRTAEFYKTEGRLQTEHALLDDTGDGKGSRSDDFVGLQPTAAVLAKGDALDGATAHQWHLVPSAAEAALPPEQRARRDALELKVIELRRRKSELPVDDYFAQLEPLLVELARLSQTMP